MRKYVYLFVLIVLMLSACEYDNYDSPDSELTGRIVFNGESVGVRQGLNVLQLYEPGWQHFEPININVKQDGTFSALLFDSDYQMVLISGNGPWVNQPDTIDVYVAGSEMMEIEVEPFFWIDNEEFETDGSTLTARFNLDQIVETSELQYVSLFIGETTLLDNRVNAGEERLAHGAIDSLNEPISINMDITGNDEDFFFARIGVKAQGNSELIFSEVQKIQMNE